MTLRLATITALFSLAACGRAMGVRCSPCTRRTARSCSSHYETGFETAHPDVDVQWVDMGSQEVLDRLRAEKANPQADLWFGAPAEIFGRAASEGLLDAVHADVGRQGAPPRRATRRARGSART